MFMNVGLNPSAYENFLLVFPYPKFPPREFAQRNKMFFK